MSNIKVANTCANCKHFINQLTKVSEHAVKIEHFGKCEKYNLEPIYPSVVFCPEYEPPKEKEE